ncbi:MAG: hypothetical protein HY608_07150 [Planctomycetes bacterium]|nr:hypothetical protein [Planctomycetota bacterium]
MNPPRPRPRARRRSRLAFLLLLLGPPGCDRVGSDTLLGPSSVLDSAHVEIDHGVLRLQSPDGRQVAHCRFSTPVLPGRFYTIRAQVRAPDGTDHPVVADLYLPDRDVADLDMILQPERVTGDFRTFQHTMYMDDGLEGALLRLHTFSPRPVEIRALTLRANRLVGPGLPRWDRTLWCALVLVCFGCALPRRRGRLPPI